MSLLQAREQELSEALSAAHEASRAKSNFLALMSHELRTPLNAIIGFSEVLGGEMFGALGNGRYRDYAHDIHGAGRHLLALINDILDLSKAEAGKFELNCEEIAAEESDRRMHEADAGTCRGGPAQPHPGWGPRHSPACSWIACE